MKHLKVKKECKRYLLLTLSVLMIVTIFSNGSIFALNENNDVPKVIASFEETTTTLSVPIETEIEDLKLPVTQKGTLVGAQESIDIPVTWDDNATYDKTKAGEYTFTANVGGYLYDGEMPTVIVSVEEKAVEEVAPTEKIDESKAEVNETLIPDKVSNLANIVIDTIHNELTKTPTISPDHPNIASDSSIVLINNALGTMKGYSTLQSVLMDIGNDSSSFVIVFIKDYKITEADRVELAIDKKASMITYTSTYNDGKADVTRILDWTGTWNSGSNTTFKDIKTIGDSSLYSNTKQLIIDEGVDTGGQNYNNSIYGFYKSTVGDVNITVKSGNWNTIASTSTSNLNVSGNVAISISGDANVGTVYPSKGKGLVKGKSTLTINGSKGAKLLDVLASNNDNYAMVGTTINLNSIAMEPSTFDLSSTVGGVTLNIIGDCKIDGKRLSEKSLQVENSINLNESAVLSLENITILSPKANVSFDTDSRVEANIKGSSELYSVNNIELKGPNAKFLFPSTTSEYLYVNGEVKGSEKLTVGFLDDKESVVGRKLVEFKNKENVSKDAFAFYRNGDAKATYKEGVEKYYKYIIYTDYVPDDGYMYEPGKSLQVGGHPLEPTDMKMQFIMPLNDTAAYKPNDYGKISTRNLFAKVAGYQNDEYFKNFFVERITENDDVDSEIDANLSKEVSHYSTVKINEKVFTVLSSEKELKHGSYKGYRYLDDGTLSLMFYLKDYGVFYYNFKIEKGSTNLDVSWTYVNKTQASQQVLVSYGGDINYANMDISYSIFDQGANSAVGYHSKGDPAMFMYVNEKSPGTPIPAVIGKHAGALTKIKNGNLFTANDGANAKWFKIDTNMGIQWQYDVGANATQKGSGGISITKPGDIQMSSNSETYENPKEDSSDSSLLISALNLSDSALSIEKENWEVKDLPDGIILTALDDTNIQKLKSANIEFDVKIDRKVKPGIYPINIVLKHKEETYTSKATIAVERDIQEVKTTVVNENGSENKKAISNIKNTTTAPIADGILYKYYDSKLSWDLKSEYIITAIEINNKGLEKPDLTKAIQDGFINFDRIDGDKNVQITVKPYVADLFITAKGSYRFADNQKKGDEYHTYAIPDSKITNVFEVNNKEDIPSTVSIPYSIKNDDKPTKIFVSSAFEGHRTDITESTSLELPANSGILYIFCEYDTKDVGTVIVDKTTKLSVGEGANNQERTITGIVAGKPSLKQKSGSSAEFYSTAEDENFNEGFLNPEKYFNGVVGNTSNASIPKSYTGKIGNAYYDDTKKFTTSPNNMFLNHYVYKDTLLIPTDKVEKKKGIYRIKMELSDMQFDATKGNNNISTPLDRYINMLDSKDFTNLVISENRNVYVDADKAIVSADTAKKMVNASNDVDKAQFVLKHKVKGATIDPTNGKGSELNAQEFSISIDQKDREKIHAGTPGVYAVTFATTGNDVSQASITTTLSVVPNGTPSTDGSRLISASSTIVKSSDAKTLTANDNAGLISALNVKTWLVDKNTGTLTEDKGLPQLSIDAGVKTQIDAGKLGEYKILKIASQGSEGSQAVINNFEYLIVVQEDATISDNKDLYIWAKDKMVDTNNIKEIMFGKAEEEVLKTLMEPSLMNVITKSSGAVNQEGNVEVEIKNGKTFSDIQEGKVGEYEIEYTSRKGSETVIITKKLTIIDNNAIWGVDIPKSIMLTEDEKSSEVSLIAKDNRYTLADFTDNFRVDVKISTNNGLILSEDGVEITATTPEWNIGRYQFTAPGGSPIQNADKGAELMETSITKENPQFTFKTEIFKIPTPIGNYQDTLTYTFTPHGLAIDKVK